MTNNEITLSYMSPFIDEMSRVSNLHDDDSILAFKLFLFETFHDKGYDFHDPNNSHDDWYEWYDYELMKFLKRNQK